MSKPRNPERDSIEKIILPEREININEVITLFMEMEKEAVDTLQREGIEKKAIIIEKSMDLRYKGQRRELTATVPDGHMTDDFITATIDVFHKKHRKIIGYSDPEFPVEVVRLHLAGISRVSSPKSNEIAQDQNDASSALKGMRKVYFTEIKDFKDVNVYEGDMLLAGNILEGPCIVEEKMTTLVVPPERRIRVDQHGNYTTFLEG